MSLAMSLPTRPSGTAKGNPRPASSFTGQVRTLLDKGFFGADLLLRIQAEDTDRHWLIPERKGHLERGIGEQGDRLIGQNDNVIFSATGIKKRGCCGSQRRRHGDHRDPAEVAGGKSRTIRRIKSIPAWIASDSVVRDIIL